ncbi:Carbamoyl-phosphate synthase small chain [Austwickia sp. TVS 96-490-7B]|uniref:glutamine-hydrolyzing carbamoyl-phosphate synthase small subunit n=1 Tax=Austwickia sp. TVS 96-490-7B TaxID=2830843 RepID=UPI001DF331BA|nr:glutamine-hydrolyzing carbamoyl-phosphate synthase small subunit [Austwickia sp. TVS 96-490-7B]MBW3086030.1 Carbamoyl-phosphate synthase small chain [Austwickia sp. TVS 96-490-7B]
MTTIPAQRIVRGPAVLVLEDGRTFTGRAFGATGTTLGEIVFCTAMTGYQETLTDPSYHRQIVVMTAPHIGNTGINDEDQESEAIQAAGFVVRDPAPRPSNWRSRRSLEDDLRDSQIVGICDIDTRALTRHLRDAGTMRAGIFTGDVARRPLTDLTAEVLTVPRMSGARLAEQVSTSQPYVVPAVGECRAVVAAIDLGIKATTPRQLAARGVEVHVLPAATTYQQLWTIPGVTAGAAARAGGPDGVFFSNGPGDPATADDQVALVRAVLDAGIPGFGICFGHQLIGRALGFTTYKLPFGHRGINQPVLDRTTGRVEITAQNHGFAVDAPLDGPVAAPSDAAHGTTYGRVEVSHIGLNDQVVEGLRCLDIPAFSVQYHPEAAAGPHDSTHLFDRFMHQMTDGTTTTSEGEA